MAGVSARMEPLMKQNTLPIITAAAFALAAGSAVVVAQSKTGAAKASDFE